MKSQIIIPLINNAALLMAMIIVYELSQVLPKEQKHLRPFLSGLLIGIIGLSIMSVPLTFSHGIIFDTRSILLCVSALMYGAVPTAIASVILLIYRVILGGSGMWMGIGVIIISPVIGLLWNRFFIKDKHKRLRVLLCGFAVHISMVLLCFLIPWPESIRVLQRIALPVLLIYPPGTLLLTVLIERQQLQNNALYQAAEAEERYRSLFENTHAVMLLIDPENGQILHANPAAIRFYGWSLDIIRQMNISEINMLSMDEVKIEMKKSSTRKKNYFLFRHRRANNSTVDVEVYSGPVQTNGKTLIFSIVHDITKRVQAEQALIESEARFKSLVKNAPDAIYISSDRRFSFVNSSALRLFGANSETELLGRSVMEFIHPDCHPIIERRYKILFEQNHSLPPSEEVYLKTDGTSIAVDVTAVPIEYNNEYATLVFARDITERKKMENSQKELSAQLRQQQKLEAIGTLAGGVAHEINNPINGIMNYAQLILDGMPSGSAQELYAKEIIHETERISVIVKNLLQFSRQEKQSHSYASMNDIISGTTSLIQTLVKKDQIALDIQLEEAMPQIKCRSQQIQQVLMNLLTNARDALNEKYPEYNENKVIYIRCGQFSRDGRRWLRLAVKDLGCGIPEMYLDKIFDPFFSTKPKDKGTGLGLSISFGIIQDHHGKITLDSKEGSHTEFTVELPVDNGWNL